MKKAKEPNWDIYTNVPEQARTTLAMKYPDSFMCELYCKEKQKYKAVWHCSILNCMGVASKPHAICRDCSNEIRRKRPFEPLYNACRSRLPKEKKRSGVTIYWGLSYEEFYGLCEIPDCHYCTSPLNRASLKSEDGCKAMLLDRKDSNGDYTIDNVVPCCPACNNTKGELLSYREIILVMKDRGVEKWLDFDDQKYLESA